MWRASPQQPLAPAVFRKLPSGLLQGEEPIANAICVAELRPPAKAQPCNWLNEYVTKPDSKKIQIFEYQYQWASSGLPVWDCLIQRSYELLDALQGNYLSEGIANRPFVLVGHGLGGLIVKRAATLLFERYQDQPIKGLKRKLAGIVLFGTPHTTDNHKHRWKSLTFMLSLYFQLKGEALYQTELQSDTVSKLSESFEGSVRDVQVISVFETKQTKTGKGLFGSKKHLLVGKELSQTYVNSEVLIPSNQDHNNVCVLASGTEVLNHFSALIENIVDSFTYDRSSSETSFATPDSISWPSTFLDDTDHTTIRVESTGSISSVNRIADRITTVDLFNRVVRPKLPCHLMQPDLTSSFFGRKDILQILDKQLLPPKTNLHRAGLQTFALCGIGGLGKSEIAIQFMASRRNQFDATFFVSADDNVKIDEEFARIAVELQLLTVQEARDRLATKSAVLEWLSRPYKTPPEANDLEDTGLSQDYAKWLLVFDDVRSATLLKEYTPLRGPGSVLITSRDPFAKHFISPNAGLDLGPLSETAATSLIQSLTYKSSDVESRDAARLVKRLDYIPIAILHAAGVIERKDSTFDEYLQRYNNDMNIRGDAISALTQGTYTQTLTTVWALESLPLKALKLLRILALIDHNLIQESLLRHEVRHDVLPTYLLANDYDEVRQGLSQVSLIRRNKHRHSLSIHKVVQDVTRQSMTKEELSSAFQASVDLINAEWEEDRVWAFGHRLSDWQLADIIVPHVKEIAIHFGTRRPSLPLLSLNIFMSLVTRASIHLKERGDWDASLSLANLALSTIESHKQYMKEQYADILMSMSSSYNCLGDPVLGPRYAHMHLKQRLLVEDAKLPESRDFSFTAMAYTEMALALLMQNCYDEAIDFAVHGRNILVKTPEFINDEYWPHWADYHISWALIGLGRAGEAGPILKTMLEWRARHYGENDTESMKTAYAFQILGVVNEKIGYITDAINCWERALLLYCRTEGDSSFRTNQVRVKLGEYYGPLGKLEAALSMFDTALKYFTGDKYYKAERARTLFKKAKFLEGMDELTQAALAMKEAEVLYGKVCLERGQECFKNPKLKDFDRLVMIMSR